MGEYRFANIIGQRGAKEHLQNALRTGKISHAYILCGERGTGRYALAAGFGQTLLCENPKESDGMTEPCGTCHACLQTISDSHPDLVTLRHKKRNASDASTLISVDDIRRMRADVQIKPYSGNHKIYIIPNADEMNGQAQNALLKTLEEPPNYAVIFLLAKGLDGFLPTVLSRCISLRLGPVSQKELEEYLTTRLEASPEKAALIAGLSHGNAGRAKFLAQSESYQKFREETVVFLKGLASKNSYEIAEFAEKVAGKTSSSKKKSEEESVPDFDCKEELDDLLLTWIRDLLMAKSSGSGQNLIFRDEVQYIKETAKALSYPGAEQMSRALQLAERRRGRGGNDVQITQMMLLAMRSALRQSK